MPIEWNQIDLKGKTSGQIKVKCPACIDQRSNKADRSLSVNIDKGVAKCHYCEEVAFREKKEYKEYKVPPQTWEEYTGYSEKFIAYLKSRGISAKTAKDCRITEEEHYFPQREKKYNAIVFNYFEGITLVNKKYRNGHKDFIQTANTKKIFYGINDIIGCEEFYIVEGEFDKVAMWEAGIKNCISVPNGANDLNDIFDTCGEYIKDAKIVYIAVDMDDKGKLLESNLVKRFGKHRCRRIEFKGKDANEDLVSGVLKESLENPKVYPVDGVYSAIDKSDEIDFLYKHGLPKPIKPKGVDWEEFNKIFGSCRGQLTTITGIPSHGKTTWLEWYLMNLINDNDLIASFYSPEQGRIDTHFGALAEKFVGKPFEEHQYVERMTMEELNCFKRWSARHLLITHPKSNYLPDWDWILERFQEQIFAKGVDIFVIDAWNKVKMNDRTNLSETSDVLSTLASFALEHDVMIFLVAHPRKMTKNEDGEFNKPTLYDVSGSADFYNITHNGITVHRNFKEGYTEVIATKIKLKHQGGDAGNSASFNYNLDNGRYYILRKDDKMLSEYDEEGLLREGQNQMF